MVSKANNASPEPDDEHEETPSAEDTAKSEHADAPSDVPVDAAPGPEEAQPIDVEVGAPVPDEPFPWEKAVKWALSATAIIAVLYFIFRRKD